MDGWKDRLMNACMHACMKNECMNGGLDAYLNEYKYIYVCVCAPRELAFTRHCHHQYCKVYGINRGGRRGGVYCTIVVQ